MISAPSGGPLVALLTPFAGGFDFGAPLAREDPQANDKQTNDDSGDQPPRLCATWSILSGDILLAIRTALGVFMDLAAAVGTRNGGFIVVHILERR
jgi:hypothetical protein